MAGTTSFTLFSPNRNYCPDDLSSTGRQALLIPADRPFLSLISIYLALPGR